MSFSYLASPYSVTQPISPQQAVVLRSSRYRRVCKMAAKLMKEGKIIFCPIAHSHPIETIGMPGELQSGDFWLEQDFAILKHASELLVYKMDGWNKSKGVMREIEFAQEHGIPVNYIENVTIPRGSTREKVKRVMKGK